MLLLCFRLSVFLGIDPILGFMGIYYESGSMFLISLFFFVLLLVVAKILFSIQDCGHNVIPARHYCSVCKYYIGNEGDSVYSL